MEHTIRHRPTPGDTESEYLMYFTGKRKLIAIIPVQIISYVLKFQLMILRSFRLTQTFQWLFATLAALSLLSVKTFASPVPALGSSALSNPSKAYMFHLRGFSLRPSSANWKLAKSESASEISVNFENAKTSGSFSVKTETLSNVTNVEHYSKRWIRDYAFFGFDVLGARPFNQGTARGYVIDLFHKKQNKQVRQVVFLKDKTSVILTCTDDQNKFKDTLNSCNSAVKTFEWL